MTAPLYKHQAARLVEHFSAVHKMRLKHASSLEAVAALHGVKDWNTLLASSVAMPKTMPTGPLTHDSALDYLFPEKSFGDPQFCNALLSVQSLIEGDADIEREVLTDQLLAHQVKRGGFLYLECGAAEKLDQLAWAMDQAGKAPILKIADFFAPELSGTYNPLEGMTAEEVSDTALKLMPATGSNPGSDFYLQSAKYALLSVAAAMLELRKPVTFLTLAEALTQPETVLLGMERLLPEGSAAGMSLKLFLDSHRKRTKDGVGLDTARLKSHIGGLAGRVAQMSMGHIGKIFNSPTGSVSLMEAVDKGLGVFMRSGPLDSSASLTLARIVLASLESVLARTGSMEHPPFTVFVSGANVSELWSKRLSTLARHGGVGVVFIEPSTASASQSLWDTSVRVSPANGFGSNAIVTLQHRPTNSSQKAILRDLKPWPDTVPPFKKTSAAN